MARLVPVPGERANTMVYYHQGFLYHLDARSNNIYRCIHRARNLCPGRAYVIDENLTVGQIVDHINHEPDHLFLTKKAFKDELFRRCRETFLPLHQIFNDLCIEYPNIAPHFIFNNIRSLMIRHRSENTPRMPQTLEELTRSILEFQPVLRIYSGHCVGADGSIALIFINPDLIEPLRQCSVLYGDGTFKIRPSGPPDVAQVYTFHFMHFLSGFPAIVAFTNRMTSVMYVAILEFILERIPELRINLTRVVIDFERAMISAVRQVLPNVQISGCLFHYSQAIIKYWRRRLRIPVQFDQMLEYALALPYLPPDRINEGLNILVELMNMNNVPNSARFHRYFMRMWIPLSACISVYRRMTRTNNVCENFHLYAQRFIGIRQSLWSMLTKLERMFRLYSVRYQTVIRTRILRSHWPAALIRANAELDQVEPRFNELGVRQYLQLIVRQQRSQFLPGFNFEDDVPLNEEEVDLLIQRLHELGIAAFMVPEDNLGAAFERGPRDRRVRGVALAPIRMRMEDMNDQPVREPARANPARRRRHVIPVRRPQRQANLQNQPAPPEAPPLEVINLVEEDMAEVEVVEPQPVEVVELMEAEGPRIIANEQQNGGQPAEADNAEDHPNENLSRAKRRRLNNRRNRQHIAQQVARLRHQVEVNRNELARINERIRIAEADNAVRRRWAIQDLRRQIDAMRPQIERLKVCAVICVVCRDNRVDRMWPACSHACICHVCLERLVTQRDANAREPLNCVMCRTSSVVVSLQ